MNLRKTTSALAIAALLHASNAVAATTPNSAITPQTPNRALAQLTAAGTVTVYTAGANGSICSGLTTSNTDASATHLLTLAIKNSSVTYVVVEFVSTEATATAVNPVSLMSSAVWPGLSVDANGNPFFYLVSGDTVTLTAATAFTAIAVVNVFGNCSDF